MEATETSVTTSTYPNPTDWKGYTIDELRMRRAYVQVKLEMEREKLFHRSQKVVSDGIIPVAGQTRSIMSKVLGALDYFDYLYIAFKTGGRLLKTVRALRRKK